VLNSLPLGFHEMHCVKTFEVNFLAEAVYGQSVAVCSEASGPLEFNHAIRDSDADLFRARSIWRKTGV
jgi:hypothetical protein